MSPEEVRALMACARGVYAAAAERGDATLEMGPLDRGLLVGVRGPAGADVELHLRLILEASARHQAALYSARVEGGAAVFVFQRRGERATQSEEGEDPGAPFAPLEVAMAAWASAREREERLADDLAVARNDHAISLSAGRRLKSQLAEARAEHERALEELARVQALLYAAYAGLGTGDASWAGEAARLLEDVLEDASS